MPIVNQFIQDTLNITWLGLGLFAAGILEAFLWKTSLFQPLNKPIQRQWFGANKRWRGLVSLPLTGALSTCLFHYFEGHLFSQTAPLILFSNFDCLEYGLLVGFIFNLAELPNSFIKRRLNIPPGDESRKSVFIIDHMDSTYGVLMLWYFYFNFPAHLIWTGLFVFPALFMGATVIRKSLGLK